MSSETDEVSPGDIPPVGHTAAASRGARNQFGSPTTGWSAPDSLGTSGKPIVLAFIAIAAAVVAYFAMGMPGMDHSSGSPMPGMDHDSGSSMSAMESGSSSASHRLLGVVDFERLVADSSVTLVNVHVPYEGEIDQTDLFIPFDAVATAELPADKSAAIFVYCLTGDMSAVAAKALIERGYTDVVELDGGMQAWEAAGRSVLVERDAQRLGS